MLGGEYDVKSEVNVEKLSTVEKVELITSNLLDQYTIRHFARGNVGIGLYRWNGKRYIPCDDEISSIIEQIANDLNIKVTNFIENEVIGSIKRKTWYPLDDNNNLVIGFDNVLIDWTDLITGNVFPIEIERGKELITFIHIPHELDVALLKILFDKGNVNVESEKQIIEEIEPDITNVFREWVEDNWLILYEIIGYTLYPDYPYHKAFMLIGSGNNGKSTYIKLINTIVGKENMAAIPLQAFIEDRFAAAQLYNKLVNTFPDLPQIPLRHTGYFKGLTGEDVMPMQRKYREPFMAMNFAKLIFSTNQLPETYDYTNAFWHRWIIIDFPNEFPESVGFFERTFTEEKIKRIIAISMWAFYQVLKREKFSIEISGEEVKEKWLRQSDVVYDFIKTMIEKGILEKNPDGKILDDELWQLWVSFANEQGYETRDKRWFTLALQKHGIQKSRTKNESYYKGLRRVDQELWR